MKPTRYDSILNQIDLFIAFMGLILGIFPLGILIFILLKFYCNLYGSKTGNNKKFRLNSHKFNIGTKSDG